MNGLIERWKSRLPVTSRTPVVTLGEGGTPLVRADRVAKAAGLPPGAVFLKLEGLNPTGSFKDRGMTLAVSKAVEAGATGVLCASTGNTSASAAAYAARAGLRCVVFLPKGKVAAGKLSQTVMHGAEIVEVDGNFDQALAMAVQAAERLGFTLVNSSNPLRIEGQKTGAFEVVETLGRAPDHHFIPVGNAGNITAYWKGYTELGHRPRMCGWQAAGAAPIVLGRPVKNPKTIATAIRIGRPVSWTAALAARDASNGSIESVTDAEILAAYRFLAREEGVFCEPSSAAPVAGLFKLAKARKAPQGLTVCVLTGHGLKDPGITARFKPRIRRVKAGGRIVL
ncbi:MAG TPA: threonine synthase [Elusimicrobia bacterium]|nr:MAG: threonine synthase [Elusimicrobia bacterium GWA2_66_18]HAZ07973.1 threonine synthase [Elusimicrobiota bacterium]